MEHFEKLEDLIKDKRIFITGVTGYVGKLVLEKFIRHFSSVKSLVIMVRGPSQEEIENRFTGQILTSQVFDPFKEKNSNHFDEFCRNKIKIVRGDVSKFRFDMKDEEYAQLRGNIDVILNIAATIKFYDMIDNSLQTNALFSAFNISRLSEECGNIPVVHVSTCYVGGFNKGVLEEVPVVQPKRFRKKYRLPVNDDGSYDIPKLITQLICESEKVRAMAAEKNLSIRETSELLVKLGTKLARSYGWNDVYTFTKWLGEMKMMLLMKNKNLSIVRPSIIESTFKHPMPGWIEGIKVADMIIVGYVLGRLRFYSAKAKGTLDIIPGDMVANSIFVALANALAQPNQSTRIYQCCSGSTNPFTIQMFSDFGHELVWEKHSSIYDLMKTEKVKKRVILVPLYVLKAMLGLWQGWIATKTGVNSISGKKFTRSINRSKKILTSTQNYLQLFSFYAAPSYVFRNDKLVEAYGKLHPSDQEKLTVSPISVDWYDYLDNHIAGLIKYAIPMEMKSQS